MTAHRENSALSRSLRLTVYGWRQAGENVLPGACPRGHAVFLLFGRWVDADGLPHHCPAWPQGGGEQADA